MTRSTAIRLTALVLTVALGAFGCATGDETETTVPQAEPTVETTAAMESGEILQVVETINEGEISHARLALRRSQNPEVQQTAEKIIQDHQALSQRIQEVADETGVMLQESDLSRDIAQQAQRVEENLVDLSGEEFDRVFLESQVEMHEMALQITREQLMPEAEDAQVQQVLSDASESLEQNLVVARRNMEAQEEAIGGGPEEDQEKMEEEDVEEMEEDVEEMEEDRPDMYEEDSWE